MTLHQIIGLGLWLCGGVLFSLLVMGLAQADKTPSSDPQLEALKAERARPRRERRSLKRIDAEAQAIVNARLRRAVGK